MSFFVLGLPRSRTAWMANFLTYDNLFCYHEGINGCSSMAEYKEKIGSDGDSCTGLSMIDFQPYFPDSKNVIIDTSIDKAVEFGKNIFNIDMTEQLMIAKDRLDATDGMHVKLNDLNHNLHGIWEYLTDSPFNKRRAENLIKLNIQVNDVFDFDIESMLKLKESNELCLG